MTNNNMTKWKLDYNEHLRFHMPKPGLKGFAWNSSSRVICATFLTISKLIGKTVNHTCVHNRDQFLSLLNERENRGLLTVSNHTSRLDDPLMWNILDWKNLINVHQFRWSTAAEDVVFNSRFSAFCMAVGKVLPLNRGAGVYQKAMDFCVNELQAGKWVHIFPEGKVNLEQKAMRFKWGVGRLIADTPVTPLVFLIHHVGFEHVFPNNGILYPRFGKKSSIYISEAIDFTQEVNHLKQIMKTPEEIRKHLTDTIQNKMADLKQEAEQFHSIMYKKDVRS
ncbi:tafazzin-like [Mercenaria mercenaria]|uniref:tafazzin-like n=1 Tax=Mercenaria mercenaria TaxID=6596 RepID=UPI00234E52D0|nr:tafazzin-like [Mercenaria mercenaria]